MNKLQKAIYKFDKIGSAMDAERQKIGGRSYDEVGRILSAFSSVLDSYTTSNNKTAEWFKRCGFSVSKIGFNYIIERV